MRMPPVGRSYYHRAATKEENEALAGAERSAIKGQSDGVQVANRQKERVTSKFPESVV
jgi:hypothetical protein